MMTHHLHPQIIIKKWLTSAPESSIAATPPSNPASHHGHRLLVQYCINHFPCWLKNPSWGITSAFPKESQDGMTQLFIFSESTWSLFKSLPSLATLLNTCTNWLHDGLLNLSTWYSALHLERRISLASVTINYQANSEAFVLCLNLAPTWSRKALLLSSQWLCVF